MRVPDNAIVDAIIAALNEPLMSCTLILPGCEDPESDPVSINEKLGKLVDVTRMPGRWSAAWGPAIRRLLSPEALKKYRGVTLSG